MNFFASLPSQRIVLDSPAELSLFYGAVHGLTLPGPLQTAAVAIARALGTTGTVGTMHLRHLHGGGVEMLATLEKCTLLDLPYEWPGVTLVQDRWEDEDGSCILVRVLEGKAAPDLPFGVVEHALGDALLSGDAWGLSVNSDSMTVLVIDGLGHGPLAQTAATAGTEAMSTMVPVAPAEDLRGVHLALTGTIGAVAGIARFDPAQRTLAFCGIGNTEATLVTGDRRTGFVSYPGVVGQRSPTFRTYRHLLSGKTHLVMHTDGIASNWSPARYPGLFSHHPALIAGVLFRDCWRQSDDALVFVIELAPEAHMALLHGPSSSDRG